MSESQPRKLVAILAADIAGYSALMGSDELLQPLDERQHEGLAPFIVRGKCHEHANAPRPLGYFPASVLCLDSDRHSASVVVLVNHSAPCCVAATAFTPARRVFVTPHSVMEK
jgi:hypothetical protein